MILDQNPSRYRLEMLIYNLSVVIGSPHRSFGLVELRSCRKQLERMPRVNIKQQRPQGGTWATQAHPVVVDAPGHSR